MAEGRNNGARRITSGAPSCRISAAAKNFIVRPRNNAARQEWLDGEVDWWNAGILACWSDGGLQDAERAPRAYSACPAWGFGDSRALQLRHPASVPCRRLPPLRFSKGHLFLPERADLGISL